MNKKQIKFAEELMPAEDGIDCGYCKLDDVRPYYGELKDNPKIQKMLDNCTGCMQRLVGELYKAYGYNDFLYKLIRMLSSLNADCLCNESTIVAFNKFVDDYVKNHQKESIE